MATEADVRLSEVPEIKTTDEISHQLKEIKDKIINIVRNILKDSSSRKTIMFDRTDQKLLVLKDTDITGGFYASDCYNHIQVMVPKYITTKEARYPVQTNGNRTI